MSSSKKSMNAKKIVKAQADISNTSDPNTSIDQFAVATALGLNPRTVQNRLSLLKKRQNIHFSTARTTNMSTLPASPLGPGRVRPGRKATSKKADPKRGKEAKISTKKES
ncbi:MAG: hypothetical protein M1817_003699 [Caeruleum heppii]|nr:MAG: hypothetical protein M1817_003699 [Caeruleum heppii]